MTKKEQIIKKIKESRFNSIGSGHGSLYQEIPYSELSPDNIKSKRTNNNERLEIILKAIPNLKGKIILDIGCNIGYFCFNLAEKGAICYGIDSDPEAIEIAEMIKDYKQLSNVNFICSPFGVDLVNNLKIVHQKIDIVILFSINHWLLSSFHSENKLIITFRHLINDNQTIFYEPSSSKSIGGYYPEMLKRKSTIDFLSKIGYDNIHLLRKSYVSNIGFYREIWKAEINIKGISEYCFKLMSSTRLYKNKFNFSYDRDKGRAIGYYNNYFIKIVNKKHSRFFSYENEMKILHMIRNHDFVPFYFFYYDIKNLRFYYYSKLKGKPLSHLLTAISYPNYFLKLEESLFLSLGKMKNLKIIHRDLNPDNIIFDKKESQIYIIDFQWARFESNEITFPSESDFQTFQSAMNRIKQNGYNKVKYIHTFETDIETALNILHTIKTKCFERTRIRALLIRIFSKLPILHKLYKIFKSSIYGRKLG